MGIPVVGGGIPATFGKVYFVNPDTGNDGNNGRSMAKAFSTLAAAYAKVESNKDDVIVLSGNSSHAIAAGGLTITKNRVHFVGVGQFSLSGCQGAKVSTAAGVVSIQTVKNLGVRNSFHNIKFINSSTDATARWAFVEGGEGTLFTDCAMQMNASLDQTDVGAVLWGGDSCTAIRCTFGNDNLLVTAARTEFMIDAVASAQSADGMKNCVFQDCIFQIQSSSATATLLAVADTAAAKFGTIFKNCVYFNIVSTGGGGIELTTAVKSVSSLVDATIYFVNPQTNSASFCTTADHFEVSGSPVFSANAFEGGTPS